MRSKILKQKKKLEFGYFLNKKDWKKSIYIQKLGQSNDTIEQEGIEKFCKDIGIDPLDPLILVLSYHMHAKEMVGKKIAKNIHLHQNIIRESLLNLNLLKGWIN